MYYTLSERCRILKAAIWGAPATAQKPDLAVTASSLLDLVKSYSRIEDKKFEVVDERNCVRTLDSLVRESLRDRIDNLTGKFLNSLYEEGIDGSVQDFASDEISEIYAMRASDARCELEEMLNGPFIDDKIFIDSPLYLEVIRLYNDLGTIINSNGRIFDDDTINITLRPKRFCVVELILDNAYSMINKLNDLIDKEVGLHNDFERCMFYDDALEEYHKECIM